MRTASAVAAVVLLCVLPATAAATEARSASEDAEAAMIEAINGVRGTHGLDALQRSSSLMSSARRYSRSLMENDRFGHANTIQASSEFSLLGEALELHGGRRFKVRATVERWMGSPSHRAIVLTKSMRWLGVGVTRGRYGSRPATIWVLHVGRVQPGGPKLPVPEPPVP